MIRGKIRKFPARAVLLAAGTLLAAGFTTELGAVKLESNDPAAIRYYEQGLRLAGEERFQEALESLREAINEDPEFVQAHLRYMDAFKSVGRGEEVIDMYANLLKQNPDSPLYHFLYGRTLVNMDAKRAEFRKALLADSTFYWAQFGIGGTYFMEERYDEAVVALNKALEMEPQLVEAMRLLGSIYLRKGLPFQARDVLLTAAEVDPEDVSIYIRLGQAYSQLNRYESAEKAFLKAAELDPDEPMIPYYIALTAEIAGQKEKARKAYEDFLEMAPDHELAASARRNLEKLK